MSRATGLFITFILVLAPVAGCGSSAQKNKNTTPAAGSTVEKGKQVPKAKQVEHAKGDLRAALLALHRVHFPYDSTTLTPEARSALADAAGKLVRNPKVYLYIDGHTDERGTTEYNMALGEKRARVVADYLGRLGVATDHLQIVSFGEEQPLSPGESTQALANNRRVEYRLLRGDVEFVLEPGALVDDSGHPLAGSTPQNKGKGKNAPASVTD